MSKVTLQYVGPELREFGGKIGDEKFVVKAAQVDSERTITNEQGDEAQVVEYKPRFVRVSEGLAGALLAVTMPAGKGKKGDPVYVRVEGDAEAESSDDDSRVEKAEGTDGRMNAEPPASEDVLSPFATSQADTIEDKATPHVYPRKGRGG